MSRQKRKRSDSPNSLPRFIHLRIHSTYSLLEGALKPKQIVQHAVFDCAPAIALTDINNLFGALEFSQYCFSEGVQPIIGCQISVDFDNEDYTSHLAKKGRPRDFCSIVLLAASQVGYAHLMRLVSRAYLGERHPFFPHIKVSWLSSQNEGLIALTGSTRGPIDSALVENKTERASGRLVSLKDIFGDRLYVELQRHGSYNQVVEDELIKLAYRHDIPLVATNEAFFLDREGYEAHDVLMAIADGQTVSNPNRRRVTQEHYLKSQDEMIALFSDLPEALENSVEIALRCHAFAPIREPILPRFIEKSADSCSALEEESEELSKQAKEGLKERLEIFGVAKDYTVLDYEQRLDYEISVITRMQFSGYFLIVSDFIKWAKAHDIPVGPGRGSGAGSLVAYALTITDIDPLRFSLLFERFLNSDRVSMPDFDIDFCQDRREEVIRYVQDKYGRDQVAQIITFGKLQARAVLRDVGRVLEMPYHQVDYLTKLIPAASNSNVKLEKAIEDEPRFEEEKKKDPLVGRVLNIALQLEGLYRHASTHAAGIVIGDRPLSDLVPMYRDPRSDIPVTQFSMKYVEQAGLVKFDFLGLKTLTVLKEAVNLVSEKGRRPKIDLSRIPLDDQKTYAMLARGETVGIFQIESSGMRKVLIGMKPDRIEDIIALMALYRPGPMENISIYNARKHGREKIVSIHPKIDHLLKETQGVILYQEQVMQIAQVLSGYSLGEADLLRRAMGKKIHEEMQKQRTRFVKGAMDGGVDQEKASAIFDLLAKFADYGFNKSHAAAYAILSYQTAYMKAHYPIEFLAASMTHDMTNTDKLNDFRREALSLGIKVVAPCVQTSGRIFGIGENCIYYSLSAIKGVGDSVADHIVKCRSDKAFRDLEDFCERIDPHIVNKRAMESLICAGACDCFGIPREVLLASLETLNARSMRIFGDNSNKQTDIFGMKNGLKEPLVLSKSLPWSLSEKLHREFQVIGFYFSAHPLDAYQEVLSQKCIQTWSTFSSTVKAHTTAVQLSGTVVAKQIRKVRSGQKIGIIQFSDTSGQYEAVLFSEELSNYGDMLIPGESFIVTFGVKNNSGEISLRIKELQPLTKKLLPNYKKMRLLIKTADSIIQIKENLNSNGSGGEVGIIVLQEDELQEVEIILPERYRVDAHVASIMRALHGVVDVQLG